MAARAKQLRQFPVVVNFAIENNGDIPLFIEDRLMAAFQINDRETSMTEPDVGLDIKALIIRSTMRDHVCHPAQRLFLDRLVVIVMKYTAYSAHARQPSSCIAERLLYRSCISGHRLNFWLSIKIL